MREGFQAGAELFAAGRRALAVVVGPGEVRGEGFAVGRVVGEPCGRLQVAFARRGVTLFAEHRVEAVPERLAGAGPGVVGRDGGAVEGGRAGRGLLGDLGAALCGEVLEEGLDDVPGRDFVAVQTGLQTVGVALREDAVPARPRVQPSRHGAQISRELLYRLRELLTCHHHPRIRHPVCYGSGYERATDAFPAAHTADKLASLPVDILRWRHGEAP